MAGESEGRQDLDISTGKGIGGEAESTSTQTREGDGGQDGGNSKSGQDGDSGTGTGDGGAAGGEGEGDALTADADGKVVHPETKQKVEPIEVANYYRTKFGESTKGAQDLLTKLQQAEGLTTTEREKVGDLEKKVQELTDLAAGKNPEGLKASEIQSKLDKTTRDLVLAKEQIALDSFERTTPLATGPMRESLKALARANPDTPLQQLWDNHLKAGAEAAAKAAQSKKDAQKNGQGEKGKGTSTREPAGGNTVRGNKGDTGLTLAEFNKLPVAERRALMEKYDIR